MTRWRHACPVLRVRKAIPSLYPKHSWALRSSRACRLRCFFVLPVPWPEPALPCSERSLCHSDIVAETACSAQPCAAFVQWIWKFHVAFSKNRLHAHPVAWQLALRVPSFTPLAIQSWLIADVPNPWPVCLRSLPSHKRNRKSPCEPGVTRLGQGLPASVLGHQRPEHATRASAMLQAWAIVFGKLQSSTIMPPGMHSSLFIRHKTAAAKPHAQCHSSPHNALRRASCLDADMHILANSVKTKAGTCNLFGCSLATVAAGGNATHISHRSCHLFGSRITDSKPPSPGTARACSAPSRPRTCGVQAPC